MTPSAEAVAGRAAARGERMAWAGLIVVFLLVYVAPLGVRPLGSPDEVRYGAIAHEMLTSGDWVSPRFNGVRYFEKPVLGHWINALSLAAFGENAFALRLPVALATGLTALIVFVLTRRFVSPFAATLAAAIFLTTLLVGTVGTFAVLDPFLSLFTTAAVATCFLALQEPEGRRRIVYLIACGIACAGAFLVKGFVGWAVPAIVVAGYLMAQRQWRIFMTLPWIPIAVAVLVSAPWAVLIHLREPDFWNYFFWVEHIRRFASDDAQRQHAPWFYLAFLPLVSWPWIVAWPAAWIGLRSRFRREPFLVFCALWALLPFVFFSIARGKLLTYILPCFPALSILLAAGLERYLTSARQLGMRIALGVLVAAFSLLLAAILAVQLGAFTTPLYGASESPTVVALCVLLALTVAGCAAAYRNARNFARVGAVVVAGVAVLVPLQVFFPARIVERLLPSAAVANNLPSRETVIVSDSSLFGTAAWTFKRDDIYVVSGGEIDYGLSYPEHRFRRLEGHMLEDLIAATRGRSDLLIVCKENTEQDIAPTLPADTARLQQGSVVFLRIPKTE